MKTNSLFFDKQGNSKTGLLAASSRIASSIVPGTDSFEIARTIQSVKDNVGIDALLNIKREGSGLGQVPQKQLETLQGLLGRLEVGRDPALLERDINDVVSLYEDVLEQGGEEIIDIMGRSPAATLDSGGGLTPPSEQEDNVLRADSYQTPDGTIYVKGADGLYYPQN